MNFDNVYEATFWKELVKAALKGGHNALDAIRIADMVLADFKTREIKRGGL